MRHPKIYQTLLDKKKAHQKSLAVLVDPDKATSAYFHNLSHFAANHTIDYFFVGGSIVHTTHHDTVIHLKNKYQIPIILFPGHYSHLDTDADAILFLSLISGRNPEYLIGQQVIAAPMIKRSGLEVISTGYMLIDSGVPTTVSYMSHALPIPYDKPQIAASTALAGEYLGMKTIFLDAGSGGLKTVSEVMVSAVSEEVSTPMIVGGGVKTWAKVQSLYQAGADIVVIGSAIEQSGILQ
ncbi:MAG: geranylgeranylglyceryl/heptaprenylglyceryl phosphate synthase [Cytophagales bacterium]|nr:geranylgeranylglyceryl/heptaprenylglyceryl phosphate synthase [Cytophagales bacterium]